MKQYSRKQVLARLNEKLASGRIVVAAGAGTGISAKFEEEGGADEEGDVGAMAERGRATRITTARTTTQLAITSAPMMRFCRGVMGEV